MTNHLQTILSCAAEPITLAQHVLESVFQLSLIKEGCGMTVQMLTMLFKGFISSRHSIDFAFLLIWLEFGYFQSAQRNQNQTANTPFSLYVSPRGSYIFKQGSLYNINISSVLQFFQSSGVKSLPYGMCTVLHIFFKFFP